jgi:integrase/recombinase XerD
MILKNSKERIKMRLEKGDILKDYQRWLKSYLRNAKHREVSENSMIVYKRVFSKLEAFIKEQGEAEKLSEIDNEFILSFLEYYEENSKNGKFSTKTKTLYISVLKSLFVYISDNNDDFYTYEKEFKGILPKKANKHKKVSYLSDADVETLVNHLNSNLNVNKHYSYIHSLGIKLMLFSGLRISEVLSLKLENIQISELENSDNEKDFYEIHLLDTKSKEEQVALIKIEHIETEMEYFEKINDESEFIFKAKNTKNPINRSNFYVSVNKIMQNLGIKRKGLHVFRHTCAMQLFRKTGNLLVLKETLRHSDIKTTMIYAHAEKRDIADAMR